MWVVYQIFAILGITAVHVFNRWSAAHCLSFASKWLINAGAQCIIAPFFILSYTLAPTFFQPWFLGTCIIALLGFGASVIFFGEAITLIKIIGALLGLIAAILLII